MAWVRASMPVLAVTSAGTVTVRDGSTTAALGIIFLSVISSFAWVLRIGDHREPGHLAAGARSGGHRDQRRSLPGEPVGPVVVGEGAAVVASIEAALAVSITEPPPIATMPSVPDPR